MTTNTLLSEMMMQQPEEAPCAPYCECEFPSNATMTSFKTGKMAELIKCYCGEDSARRLAWRFEPTNQDTVVEGNNMLMHPVYSQGTVIMRGNKPLEAHAVHFWEMRAISVLSGTDVMFGFGTDKVDLEEYKYRFFSALGANNQSWALSYTGHKHHEGINTPYGQKFAQGCIIGILLDRTRGYAEFFINRHSLGIAFTGLPLDPNIKLYPMISSTAAKSVIRLINATSHADCLELRSYQALASEPRAFEVLRQTPGLRHLMHNYWFLTPPIETELDLMDEAVLSDRMLRRRRTEYLDEEIDTDDIYANLDKMPPPQLRLQQTEDDHDMDDMSMMDYFDEYLQERY